MEDKMAGRYSMQSDGQVDVYIERDDRGEIVKVKTYIAVSYTHLDVYKRQVGKVSKNVVPMCTNQDIVSITNIDDNFNLVFLKYLLDEYLDFFNGQKRGATIQGIKSETLKNILVPKVNLKLQNDFEQFVNHVDKSKYVAPYK